MIGELSSYAVMRDSGVDWLGAVPAHWGVRRLKYLLRERDARSRNGDEQLLRVSQHTGITERKRDDGAEGPDTRAASLVGYKAVDRGDLAVNIMLAWNGSLGVSPYGGIVSPAYGVYRFNSDVEAMFFHHLLRSPIYKARIKTASRGVVESRLRLYTDDLYRIEALLPPRDEQAAIVRFLDHADCRIRRAIATKQKLIRLLGEQKRAIIHHAVTRGLDPDVRLKPSGVGRLGDVPEHWNLRQLRRLVSMVTSGSRGWASYYADDGSIFLQSGNLGRSMRLKLENVQHVALPRGSEGERTRVAENDVLVCITGALTGNVALVDLVFDKPAFVNQHVALVRPVTKVIYPQFLALVLHSEIGKSQFKISEYGGTKQGLSLNDVKSVFVPVPSIDEQMSICDCVDEATREIVSAITKADKEILLIREFRVRLVADVVTGKLDVRQAAATLPEMSEPMDSEFDVDDENEAELMDEDAAEDQAA